MLQRNWKNLQCIYLHKKNTKIKNPKRFFQLLVLPDSLKTISNIWVMRKLARDCRPWGFLRAYRCQHVLDIPKTVTATSGVLLMQKKLEKKISDARITEQVLQGPHLQDMYWRKRFWQQIKSIWSSECAVCYLQKSSNSLWYFASLKGIQTLPSYAGSYTFNSWLIEFTN